MENLLDYELNIYFKYEKLDAADLVEILNNFNRLYNKLLNLSSPVYIVETRPCRNFMEVTSINTGESINIKLKEGWRPEFKIENGGLSVYCPKKLGVPVLIFFLVLTGIQRSIGLYNQYQDMELKKIELKIKEIELYQKMEELRRMKGIHNITQQVNKTINFLLESPRLTHIEINGYELPKKS